MKAILLSIKPEWAEKILNGEKTIEIRKTMPRCELPIDVYIYCTKGLPYLYYDNIAFIDKSKTQFEAFKGLELNGKVVAKFTLNKIDTLYNAKYFGFNDDFKSACCLSTKCIDDYAGIDKVFYAWHIDNLKIFEDSKELSNFKISKAPQSWCYIDETKLNKEVEE